MRWILLTTLGLIAMAAVVLSPSEHGDTCENARATLETASVAWNDTDSGALPSPDRQMAATGYWTALRRVDASC